MKINSSEQTYLENHNSELCPEKAPDSKTNCFGQALKSKQEYESYLKNSSLLEVVEYWRNQARGQWQSKHKEEIEEMVKYHVFPEKSHNGNIFTIDDFLHIQQPSALRYIQEITDWPNEQKNQIIECYKAFVNWLSAMVLEDDRKALQLPSTEENKVINFMEWRTFCEQLGEQNKRDEIAARLLLQGKRRVSEVINLTLDQINFEKNLISYQTKKELLAVEYDQELMQELNQYIQATSPLRKNNRVFITRTGKPLSRRRLNYSFASICEKNNIKKITPDNIRILWDVFKKQKYNDKVIIQSKQARIEEGKKMWQLRIEEMLKKESSK